jgi:hypothetical protein
MKTDKDDQAEDEADPKGQDWHWADPKSLKVNPAFQRLIPLQSREEFRALEASLQEEGCRDPLTVWKGHNVILDGHTRHELCLEHKLKVKVREVELEDEKAAVEYILQLQRQRRNLTREAMSYFRGSEYNRIKHSHGGDRRGRRPKDQREPLRSTASLLAGKYGVSSGTIKRDGVFARVIDKIVEEHGDPEIKRKLLGADVKLTHGTARALLKLSAKERKKAVDELVERGERPRAKKGERKRRRPKELAHSLIARLQKRSEAHARSVVQQMAKLLGLKVVEERG